VFSEQQRSEVERLFRAGGYDAPVRVAKPRGGDERVFLVETDDVVISLPRQLTIDLQRVLGCKVLIASGSEWGPSEPLR
jgi:hypothetical protein